MISCTEICHLCSSLKGLIKSRSEHKSRCGQMPSSQGVLSCLRQFLATESPLKRMKNAFYFTSKALFVLKIFKFLSWYFGHVAKRLDKKDKVNFKFYYVTRSKGNQKIKLGQLIVCNMRNIFIKKSCTKCGGETSPRPLSEKLKLSISYRFFLLYGKLRAIEIYWN